MADVTRRGFIQAGVSAAMVGREIFEPGRLMAYPLGLPLGLQLYSVREQLPADFAGTLAKLGQIGYREVEGADVAGLYKKPVDEVKQALAGAGLRWVSAHYSWGAMAREMDRACAYQKELGAEYVICDARGRRPPAPGGGGMHELSMDDWRWNAENFNHAGEKAKAAGLRFGYHNHVAEFAAANGVVPYDELLRLTDPALVTFEMDCGWVSVGGGDPIAYLKKFPNRISMLHVKDFKAKAAGQERPDAANLGQGTVDFHPIFAAVSPGQIKHLFVEQEGFDVPWADALRIDADYMKQFRG